MKFHELILCVFTFLNIYIQTQIMRKLLLQTLVLLLSFGGSAQTTLQTDASIDKVSKSKHRAWEIGLLAGAAVYTGDLHCEQFFLKAVNPGGGIFGRYYFSDVFSTRLNLQASKVRGSDLNYGVSHAGRNFSFKSLIYDANLTLEWEPFGRRRYKDGPGQFRRILSPYVNAGVGYLYTKPTVDFALGNTNSNLADIAIDQANKKYTHLVIPFGAGVRYDLSERVTLGVEGNFRKTFTDYIDGVSQTADSKKNDWYYTANVLLGYRFDYKRDADKDGIVDEEDACPYLPGKASTKGCPDFDGDGVADRLDKCPNEKGVSYLDGCPDRDGDGVADQFDNCPDVAGDAKYAGCPDTDGDGIIDSNDDCPNARGLAKFGGCPDTDGDGIADKFDSCPTVAGTVEENGCPPKDTDGDGIVDKDDKCPTEKGEKVNGGCPASGIATMPEVVKTVEPIQTTNSSVETVISEPISTYTGAINSETSAVFQEALYGIQFETGSSVITKSSYTILNRVYSYMIRSGAGNSFNIGGHTDNVGNADANMRLSDARAKAVFNYLVSKGIRANRLTYKGYGDTTPIETNSTTQGRAKNRRVEFNMF